MWSSPPTKVSYVNPYIISYCQHCVDVYDVRTAEWVQTVPLQKCTPFNFDGTLSLCVIDGQSIFLYWRDTRLEENERLLLPDVKRDNASIVPRRVVSTKTANRQSKIFGIKQSQPLRNRLLKDEISAPANFNHISHMGPYDGHMMLLDIPQATQDPALKRTMTSAGMLSSRSSSTTRSNESGLERNTPGMERSASSATDLYNYRYTKKQNEARSHEARSHESKRGSTPDSVKRVEECDDEVTEDSLLDGFSQEQLDFLNADQQR